MPRTRHIPTLAGPALLVFLTGCAGPVVDGTGPGERYGTNCFLDDECGEDLECVLINPEIAAICTHSCEGFQECPDGSRCVPTFDGIFCVPVVELEPADLSNNPNNADPVPNNQGADPDNSENNNPAECLIDEDCGRERQCVDSTCVGGDLPDCTSDNECGPDEVCGQNGECVSTTPECGDRYEPNDEISSATPIESGVVDQLVLCPGDVDTFALQVSQGATVSVAVRFVHEDGNIDIELLDGQGELLTRSSSATDDEELSREVGAAGFYYVRVFRR